MLEVDTHINLRGVGLVVFLTLFRDQAAPGHRRLNRFQPGAGRGAVAVHQLVQDLEVGLCLDPGLGFERQTVFADVADGQGQFSPEDRRVGQDLVVVKGEIVTRQDSVEVFHPQGQVEDEARVPAVRGCRGGQVETGCI